MICVSCKRSYDITFDGFCEVCLEDIEEEKESQDIDDL